MFIMLSEDWKSVSPDMLTLADFNLRLHFSDAFAPKFATLEAVTILRSPTSAGRYASASVMLDLGNETCRRRQDGQRCCVAFALDESTSPGRPAVSLDLVNPSQLSVVMPAATVLEFVWQEMRVQRLVANWRRQLPACAHVHVGLMNERLRARVATMPGHGYWEVGVDGCVYAFGYAVSPSWKPDLAALAAGGRAQSTARRECAVSTANGPADDASHEPDVPTAQLVRELAREGVLAARCAAATPRERRQLSAAAYGIVWPVVYGKLTRLIERRRGRHWCHASVSALEAECLDRFHDAVDVVRAYVFRQAKVPIGNIEGWIAGRLTAATYDGLRCWRGERGAFQRPRLPRWLAVALDDYRWLTVLAFDVLAWLGVQVAAGTGLWPLTTWAEYSAGLIGDHTGGEVEVTGDLETVLTAMHRRRGWDEEFVERPPGCKHPMRGLQLNGPVVGATQAGKSGPHLVGSDVSLSDALIGLRVDLHFDYRYNSVGSSSGGLRSTLGHGGERRMLGSVGSEACVEANRLSPAAPPGVVRQLHRAAPGAQAGFRGHTERLRPAGASIVRTGYLASAGQRPPGRKSIAKANRPKEARYLAVSRLRLSPGSQTADRVARPALSQVRPFPGALPAADGFALLKPAEATCRLAD